MDGFEIILTSSDGHWTGTTEFVRDLAVWLGVEQFESLCIYHVAPSSSELHPRPEQESKKILDVSGPSLETALELQRTDAHCTTVMNFGFTPMIEALAAEVTATLPASLSQGWTPLEGSLYNGPWKHYDFNSGDLKVDSGCCLILGNNLGYPVDLAAYLEAFLKVPSVVRLRQRLEELSGRQWHALIDLT